MGTDLSSLLESVKDEKSQIAIAKVFDEFKLLTLGKNKMDIAESMEIKEYCRKRTNLEISNDKLAPEQLAWKHIYILMDEQIINAVGKEEKDKLDHLKTQMNQLDSMNRDVVEKLLPLGRQIEELFIRQRGYLCAHFNDGVYKKAEERMSVDMLAEHTPTQKRIELANGIIALVERYKGIILSPLFDDQNKIYEALLRFRSIFEQIPFSIANKDLAIAKIEKLYGDWLSLSEELQKERLKTITGLRNLIELDVMVPENIIKNNGDKTVDIPLREYSEKIAAAKVLSIEGPSKEEEIEKKRRPLSIEAFGDPDSYIKFKENEVVEETDNKSAKVNPLQGKAWFRLLKVIYILACVFGGAISIGALVSGFKGAIAISGIIVLILFLTRKVFYYIVLGRTNWK
jgi:hypothetical protein